MGNRFGRYELIEKLGSGGMGDVWSARDPKLGREVAVKTIRRELADPDIEQRFLREARAAAQCRHPGIVTIFDFGVEGGAPFLVMERVHGRTLSERIAADGALPATAALGVAVQVAEALAHAHGLGVLHRDVTPANVVVTPDGAARLLDFGLVRDLGSPTSELSTQALLGTPAYMAPEQAFGAPEEVDARADVYGVGATLFAALTGRPPFEAPTLLALLRRIEEQPVATTGCGADVDAVLARALAKDREHRFADASQLAAALRAAAAAGPTQVEAAPAPKRLPPVAIAAIAMALLLLVVALGRDWSPEPEPGAIGFDGAAFDLRPDRDGDARLLELVGEGRFGEAAELRPIASVDSWVALSLCSPHNLRRQVFGPAFHAPFVAPVAAASDSVARAGMHVLQGRPELAFEIVDARREAGEASPRLSLVELHALLALSAEDFDEPRAEALLHDVAADVEDRASPLHVLATSGLLDLLRLRAGHEEPMFFDVEERTDVFERELVASLLLAGSGRFDEAIERVEGMREHDPHEPWLLLHLAWLQMAAGLEEQERFTVEPLLPALRELATEAEPEVRYPAAVLVCVHATLHGDEPLAARMAEVANAVAEANGFDAGELPFPAGGLVADRGDGSTRLASARRDLFESFGERARALALGRSIDRAGASELDDDEDRLELLVENALACARCASDDERARLAFVLRAIDLGADEERLREEEELEALLERADVRERLQR